jgi:isopentenyl-diphosphate delta-isomerase
MNSTNNKIYQKLDRVVLVNADDEVIGSENVIETHKGLGKLHRACSVFLFNATGEVLIQKRSKKKIVAANQWANTACGNVRLGESYLDCAKRRLKEELGIEGVGLSKVGKFQYQVSFDNGFSENEIDTVFVGDFKGELKPNPDEVSEVGWIQFKQLLTAASNFAPWVSIILSQKNIKQNLANYA